MKSNKTLSPKKDDKSIVLSSFKGTWGQSIYFDDRKSISFETNLPCVLEDYGDCLPSDSTFRTDVELLMERKVQMAQDEKMRLE